MSELKIGFGRSDITPPLDLYMAGDSSVRKGEGWLDDLAASALAFSDGEKSAVVITIDNIGFTQVRGDELRNIVSKAVGLPYEAVFYCCTHTHNAPSIHGGYFPVDHAYNSVFYRTIADAAKAAMEDLSPAQVRTARGEVKDISFIRRFKMKDGTTRTNPGRMNPDIACPIGDVDEQLQLVRILREGKDDLVLLNFQTHPCVVGTRNYSADWPGYVRRMLEGALPNIKCLYFNGAEGDTNHIDVRVSEEAYIGGIPHAKHMAMCVVGEALKLYTYAKPAAGTKVDFIQKNIRAKVNKATDAELEQAEKYIALYEAERYDEIPFKNMEFTTIVYESYRMRKTRTWNDTEPLYLNAVRFGDVAFSGIPGEPFTEVGVQIKANSPFGMTIPCCCANGYEAYYPTKDAFEEGGYEARSCEFAAGCAEQIIDESLAILKEIY